MLYKIVLYTVRIDSASSPGNIGLTYGLLMLLCLFYYYSIPYETISCHSFTIM